MDTTLNILVRFTLHMVMGYIIQTEVDILDILEDLIQMQNLCDLNNLASGRN